MALTEIKYGSLASSEIMNKNFQYLDNRTSEISNIITVNNADISSNIANINNSLNTMQENINRDIKELQEKIYIQKTYVNGSSGYRIWSDNYCEQWGYSDFANTYITFIKEYVDTNYNITFGIDSIGFEVQMALPTILERKKDSFRARYVNPKGTSGSGMANWHCYGFIEKEIENGI